MRNILLAGVGGQGIVLASKLIAACAIRRGEAAHTAETIGMAQRGGSVVSHVRLGNADSGPLIPRGQADLIIAFEPAEAVRCLPYLKEGGAVMVNTSAIQPASDTLSGGAYHAETMLCYLREKGVRCVEVDGAQCVREMGSAKMLNVAMLGAAAQAGLLGYTPEELEEAVVRGVRARFVEGNRKALCLGAQAVREFGLTNIGGRRTIGEN